MCGGSQPQDNSAEIARQQEQERQDRIKQGQTAIDNSFNVFTPEYFDKYKQDYLGYYNPQIDDRYSTAQQDLRYNTARAGILDSSGGLKLEKKLGDAYTDQRRAISSDALDATNKIRQSVEQNKSDLYAQNTASADPSLAAISAVGRAGSLQTAPSYSPVGDIFNGLTNAGTYYVAGANKGLPSGYNFNTGSTLPTGYGSGRVTR